MGNPFQNLANIKQTVKQAAMPQYKGRTRIGNEDREDWRAQQQAQAERGFKYEQYIKPGRPGDVPINVKYGVKQPKPPAQTNTSKVPRERWLRDTTAQQQGPRPDGRKPGMVPYVGPYPNAAQRVPTYLDPTTKRYTPGTPAEYQTWLDGSAFGYNRNNGEIPRFSGMTPTDLEMANVRRAQQGLPPLSNSVLQSANQSDTDMRKAWAAGIGMEDASDRAARRNTVTTLGGIGRSMADAAENVYGALAANTKRYADPYAEIERIRLNRGAPADNLSEGDLAMPAYTGGSGYGGGGYGGYGGGGGGGGYPDTPQKKWLANMASWRI